MITRYVLPWTAIPKALRAPDYRYYYSRTIVSPTIPYGMGLSAGSVHLLNGKYKGQCGPNDWQWAVWNWQEEPLRHSVDSWSGVGCTEEQARRYVDKKLRKLGFKFVTKKCLVFL